MTRTTQKDARLIEPDELPIWVPGKVLCESKGLGWRDVSQRTYRYHGQDVHIPPMNTWTGSLTGAGRALNAGQGISLSCRMRCNRTGTGPRGWWYRIST